MLKINSDVKNWAYALEDAFAEAKVETGIDVPSDKYVRFLEASVLQHLLEHGIGYERVYVPKGGMVSGSEVEGKVFAEALEIHAMLISDVIRAKAREIAAASGTTASSVPEGQSNSHAYLEKQLQARHAHRCTYPGRPQPCGAASRAMLEYALQTRVNALLPESQKMYLTFTNGGYYCRVNDSEGCILNNYGPEAMEAAIEMAGFILTKLQGAQHTLPSCASPVETKVPSIAEVEWSIEVEPESMPVEDMFGEEDRESLDKIYAEMDAGNVWAWAAVSVKGRWKGLESSRYIGGCSYKDQQDFIDNSGYYEDLKEEVRSDLQEAAAAIVSAVNKAI
jgi:hypothetical protein